MNLFPFLQDLPVPYKSFLAANTMFWLMSGLCLAMDCLPLTTPAGKYLQQHKIQGSKAILSTAEYWDIFWVAVWNMGPVSIVIIQMEQALRDWFGIKQVPEDAEWLLSRELLCIVGLILTIEIWFYWTHRLLHHPLLYSRIHKMHHRFKAPCAMAAVYAHPIEFMFANVGSIALSPVLTGSHPYTAYGWFALALVSNCCGHSGYDFLGAHMHDAHHEFYTYNYGAAYWMNYLFGTKLPKDKKQ